MNIQSDQLVYEYLSKVGDATQGVLPPARRVEFVTQLRQRIDRERSRARSADLDTIRQILDQIGDPRSVLADEVLRDSPDHPSAPTRTARTSSGNTDTALLTLIDEAPDEIRPIEPSHTPDDATALPARRSWAELRRLWSRIPKRELIAVAVLLFGALINAPTILIIGFVIVLSSLAFTSHDKRVAILGVPTVTGLIFGVTLWLRASGRVGGPALTADGVMAEVRDVLGLLPRMIGIFAACYLGWRISRLSSPDQ